MATIYQPDQNEEENAQSPLNTQTGGGPAAMGNMSAQQSQAAAPARPKGSGRFTNLQKYLQANQTGGQRIASGIGEKIQDDLSQKQQQSQDYYGKIAQGIQQAKGVAQQGSQFLGQLRGIGENIQSATGAEQYAQRPQDLGIQSFTDNPQFGQFQNIQAGRGIDENLLQSQQQDLTGATQQYLGASQQALSDLGSEGGRFDLLKRTFGGAAQPQYTTGQRRLDQLFLARQGLQPLQEDVRGDVRSAKELMRQAADTGAQVGSLRQQESQLMQNIGQQSSANEQAYLDMLSSYVPEVNRLRQQEWQQLEDALSSYRPPAEGQVQTTVARPGLTQDQLSRLGIDRAYGAFNVLEELDGATDIAQRGREAQGYQDVAQEQDVNRYAALSRIAGLTPEAQRLTRASDLGDAWAGRTDDGSLKTRLERADELFRKRAGERGAERRFGVWANDASGNTVWSRTPRNVSGAFTGNFGDLLRQGKEGIQGRFVDLDQTGQGQVMKDLAERNIWDDFRGFLREQGFDRTIGGQGPDRGYGERSVTMPGTKIPGT